MIFHIQSPHSRLKKKKTKLCFLYFLVHTCTLDISHKADSLKFLSFNYDIQMAWWFSTLNTFPIWILLCNIWLVIDLQILWGISVDFLSYESFIYSQKKDKKSFSSVSSSQGQILQFILCCF